MDKKLTWTELILIEHRLLPLYRKACAIRDDKQTHSFCANKIWYEQGGLKDHLVHLVGWEAENRHSRLITADAYDLVYEKIYNVLPACRNCMCL